MTEPGDAKRALEVDGMYRKYRLEDGLTEPQALEVLTRAPPRPPHLRPFARAKAAHVLGPSRWTTAPVRIRRVDPAPTTNVDIDVDFARPSDRKENRVRRIILRLADGTTPIPKLAVEFGVSKSAVHSIAERAVRKGLLDLIPGKWPNMYRPGPNLLRRALYPPFVSPEIVPETVPMRHKGSTPENRASRTFTLRAHALQASLPVLSLDRAEMGAWTSWATKTGPMYKVDAGGLRMQLRGGTGRPVLVVSIPALTLEATEETIQEAAQRIKAHVAEYVTLARKVAHEKYRIVAGSPAKWYRKPDVAIERFPGIPEGVKYVVSFWVDSSLGPAEVESTKLETIKTLMSIGNEISRDLSMSTF